MSVSSDNDLGPENPSAGGVVGLGQVEEFLRRAVQQMRPVEEGVPKGAGRPRVLPSMCLWAGMLVCVLRGMSSQLELWRLLASKGLWEYPRFEITDQAVYNRLAREGIEPLRDVFEHVSALLRERLKPYELGQLACFATEVVAIDQSTLDKVARLLPALKDAHPHKALAGKLAGVFDVRAQQWRHLSYIEDAQQNEKVSARGLLEGVVKPGALVLFDLGYFSFEWFDHLTDSGYRYLCRLRARTSYEVIHTYYEDDEVLDCVVWLGKHRADRASHAVRLVRLRVGHEKTHAYITNVLDPELFPLHEVPRLYGRRWDFELAIKLVKRELGLHLLWGCKRVVIEQQVWAVLIVAQVLQALRMEVAGRAEVEVEEVSMELLVRYMPRFASRGLDPLKEFVEQGRALGFIRPSRRIDRRAPRIPPELLSPLAPKVVLRRMPRYSKRKCGPRVAPRD